MEEFRNPQSVTISKSRWEAKVTIFDEHGQAHHIIFSADRAFTEGDGLWMGDYDDYEEMKERIW